MGEVIDLTTRKTKNKIPVPTSFMVGLSIYRDDDGALEVSAEIGENYTDFEIFEAIMAAAWKFAEDNNLVEDVEDDYS